MALWRLALPNAQIQPGKGLPQQPNRDTLQLAFKCAAVVVDGLDREVYKSPILKDRKFVEIRRRANTWV